MTKKSKLDRQTDRIEAALYKRARGYRVREITFSPDPESGECCKTAKIVEKDVAPNVQAAMIWLKTFRPEIWAKTPLNDDDGSAAELYRALDNASVLFDDGGAESEET
jgi:hypothetical protein